MSKLLKLEIFLLVLSQFLDFVTTIHVLNLGGMEINPVMVTVMRHSGILGFFAVKLLLIALIPPAIIYLLSQKRRPALYLLRTVNLFYLFVVTSNLRNFTI